MQTPPFIPTPVQSSEDVPFTYRGCHFICSASAAGEALYQPHVLYEYGLPGVERITIATGDGAYASSAEALKHAEQRAKEWVDDRNADAKRGF